MQTDFSSLWKNPVIDLRGILLNYILGEYVKGFECRANCGACCIAPSISSSIPGMPQGKPAGVPCVNLDENMRCRIFGSPERPAVCKGLQPSLEMCRSCREEALTYLEELEKLTCPQ